MTTPLTVKPTQKEIKVWVVDDDKELRSEVCRLINTAKDIECDRQFRHCEELFEFLETREDEPLPDVLFMDYFLDVFEVGEHMTGIEGASRLKSMHPDIAIVMLTIQQSIEIIFKAIGSGACGYVVKPPRQKILVSAIRQALDGGLWMPPMVAQRVSDHFRQHMPGSDSVLTDREKEVLVMMENGMKQKQIASEMELSRHTVDSHLRRIYQKLHVNSAHEALAKAIRRGYL